MTVAARRAVADPGRGRPIEPSVAFVEFNRATPALRARGHIAVGRTIRTAAIDAVILRRHRTCCCERRAVLLFRSFIREMPRFCPRHPDLHGAELADSAAFTPKSAHAIPAAVSDRPRTGQTPCTGSARRGGTTSWPEGRERPSRRARKSATHHPADRACRGRRRRASAPAPTGAASVR